MPEQTTPKELMIQDLMKKRTVSEDRVKKILSIIQYLTENSKTNEDIDISYEIECLCECMK